MAVHKPAAMVFTHPSKLLMFGQVRIVRLPAARIQDKNQDAEKVFHFRLEYRSSPAESRDRRTGIEAWRHPRNFAVLRFDQGALFHCESSRVRPGSVKRRPHRRAAGTFFGMHGFKSGGPASDRRWFSAD